MTARRYARRERRFNAWLSGLLTLGVVVAGNALAREHLALRHDFSAERLHALAPATRSLLAELTDELAVVAYFTGDVVHGPVQLAKRRLLDQLGELEAAAGGRLVLELADPNADSQARLAAARYGIAPVPMRGTSGSAVEEQEVWLGLVLRYRGRERAIPFVLPQGLEYAFAFELRRLLRDAPAVVGFYQPDAQDEHGAPFRTLREILARQYDVREVRGLAAGAPVDADVVVLIVPRPVLLHPREVFALDQFAQRGGRLLLLLDEVEVDTGTGAVVHHGTGLDALLRAFGLALSGGHVFDLACNNLVRQRVVQVDGREQTVPDRVQYPLWPAVREDGLSTRVPATARLSGAELFWAQELELTPVEGVEHIELLTSSEHSWVYDGLDHFAADFEVLDAIGAELAASGGARRRALAVAASGRWPSPFTDGAPAPRDAVAHALWESEARAAAERGAPAPPAPPVGRTTEPVASAASAAQVVVLGDADWASDGRFLTERNRLLFENLVDWLALEDELLALRARFPRERPIRDFLAEEREHRGIAELSGRLSWDRAEELSRAEQSAAAAAARRRNLSMAAATGGSLALALVLGLALRGRAVRGFTP